MKYLYKQTGIVVESDDVLDSTMFKLIIEEKTEDLIEDSETETGVAEAENTEEPVEEQGPHLLPEPRRLCRAGKL